MRAEVYTKPNCPYCVKAKHLLEKQGIPFVEISAVANREALIERVTKTTGAAPRTVPQIYLIDNDREEYVGGYDQLAARYNKE